MRVDETFGWQALNAGVFMAALGLWILRTDKTLSSLQRLQPGALVLAGAVLIVWDLRRRREPAAFEVSSGSVKLVRAGAAEPVTAGDVSVDITDGESLVAHGAVGFGLMAVAGVAFAALLPGTADRLLALSGGLCAASAAVSLFRTRLRCTTLFVRGRRIMLTREDGKVVLGALTGGTSTLKS